MTPEEPLTDSPHAGISRRKMLKRIGAATAVAWTAPIITSMQTPAFAQYEECDCPPYDCANPSLCENTCQCAPHHGGGPCICWSTGYCAPCEQDSDCAAFHLCGDVNPNCSCGGNNTACLSVLGCTGSRRTRPLKGLSKR